LKPESVQIGGLWLDPALGKRPVDTFPEEARRGAMNWKATLRRNLLSISILL
jgi:hypothetical protein